MAVHSSHCCNPDDFIGAGEVFSFGVSGAARAVVTLGESNKIHAHRVRILMDVLS